VCIKLLGTDRYVVHVHISTRERLLVCRQPVSA
jgi:hypothetical protein